MKRLDVRTIEGPPFSVIDRELSELDRDDELCLIADFEPEPLYDVLEDRGFEYAPEERDDGEWHVQIKRRDDG